MFAMLKRMLAYRRLRPVMTSLPRHLSKAFGSGDRYTIGQARRAIADLKMGKWLHPYALAAACAYEVLQEGAAGITANEYRRLRRELAQVFDIREDFTMGDLLKPSFTNHHSPAPESAYTSGHSSDTQG